MIRQRHVDYHIIKNSSDKGVDFEGGSGTMPSAEIRALLKPGMQVGVEIVQGSMIVGWLIDGQWHGRKTDEELDAEHAEWQKKWRQEKIDRLEENREAWTAREAALPAWLGDRLATFREKGTDFELEGWGYELVICELAAAYAEQGEEILGKDSFSVVDSPAVKKISEEQGTSGNQHGMALALAQAHLEDPERSMGGTVSALSPLGSGAFYDKEKKTDGTD